jgi:hypothetical protein
MSQAQALQVLVRAYDISGQTKYINTAKELLNSFFVEVKSGGVTYKTPKNGWWFEQNAGSPMQPRILNGMIWTLLGIYDYYNHTKDPDSKYLFDQGLLALKINLPLYDNNGSSYYDILGTPAKLEYHKMHVILLEELYNITKEPIFKIYHDRWNSFNDNNSPQVGIDHIILDSFNVPFVDYGIRQGVYIGLQRNPVTVEHTALEFYMSYKRTWDAYSKQSFLNNADWLMNNSIHIHTRK